VYASTSDLDTGHPSGGRQLNVHRIYSYQPYLKPPAPLRIQPLTSVWVATPGPPDPGLRHGPGPAHDQHDHRQQYCPPAMLGRVTASMRFAAFGMVPLGSVLAGTLGTVLGVRDALVDRPGHLRRLQPFLLTSRIRTARNLPRGRYQL
jgi:hypothetical protein